jgi:hypothetical protein
LEADNRWPDGEFVACNHLRSRQKLWHYTRYHTSKRYCGQPVQDAAEHETFVLLH